MGGARADVAAVLLYLARDLAAGAVGPSVFEEVPRQTVQNIAQLGRIALKGQAIPVGVAQCHTGHSFECLFCLPVCGVQKFPRGGRGRVALNRPAYGKNPRPGPQTLNLQYIPYEQWVTGVAPP